MKRVCSVVIFVFLTITLIIIPCLAFAQTSCPYNYAQTWSNDFLQTCLNDPLCVLAQRFRPYLLFSHDSGSDCHRDEPYHPVTWQWFVENSNLYTYMPGSDGSYLLYNWGPQTVDSLLTATPNADIRLNSNATKDSSLWLVPQSRYGEQSDTQWDCPMQGDGIYAHAERVPGTDLINIEYIMLYAFNKGGCNKACNWIHNADHNGDMTFVNLVYSTLCDQIVHANFVQHGNVLLSYDLNSYSDLEYVPVGSRVVGQQVNARRLYNIKNYYEDDPCIKGGRTACLTDFHWGCSYNPSCIDIGNPWGCCSGPGQGDCNEGGAQVYFVQDPDSGRYEHIAVYIEFGTHEPWPAPCGGDNCVPEHNGNAQSFLPAQVTYLGTMDDMIIGRYGQLPFIFFNGLWGNDPKPAIMHNEWYYPHGRGIFFSGAQPAPFQIPTWGTYNPFVDPDPYMNWWCSNGNSSPMDVGSYPIIRCEGNQGLWPPADSCAWALEKPDAKCKDVTVTADSTTCSAVASIDNGSTCPGFASCTLSQNPPGPYRAGNVVVVFLTATDGNNHAEQCKATVRVNRPQPVMTINQPAAVNYPHSATITLDYNVQGCYPSYFAYLDGMTTVAGHNLNSGQTIPLTDLRLGAHTFTLTTQPPTPSVTQSVTFWVNATCADLAIIKASFGKRCGQTGFDPRADLDQNCVVDVRDLAIASKALPPGTHCP